MALRNTDPRTSENRKKSLNAIIAQAKIYWSFHPAVFVRENPQKTKLDQNGQIKKGSISYEVYIFHTVK